jgi:hypothetical protein
MNKVVNTVFAKSDPDLDFFLGDCGLNPHYLSAFTVSYFPFLVYFHQGLPFESMPAILTQSEVLTTKWIMDIRSKFKNYSIGENILAGTKIKNSDALFQTYLKILRKKLFVKNVMKIGVEFEKKDELLEPSMKTEFDGAQKSNATLEGLKHDKSIKMASKNSKK